MKRYLWIFAVSAVFCLNNFVPLVHADDVVVSPIRILIVPGHDNEVFGGVYRGTKEANLTLALGNQIYDILKSDKRFEVYITRDESGYTKEFADYFANQADEIKTFKENAQSATKKKIANGTFVEKASIVPHTSAPEPMALKLYGINKWANENNIDAIINIHFNDDGRKNRLKPGPYKGYSVYMPDVQLLNHDKSMPLAQEIFKELRKKYNESVYIKENKGVIADQKLIVLGASNTLLPTVRSVLIEYGFIYEKKFSTYALRKNTFKSMGEITANSLINYFFPKQI